ncbi:conserved hypothetical protein [Ricinus communis]|uniref:Uncharacterized protein n=1 Tax=Ricinus communis TaxID=3988 RepID=B9R9F2_RICCO|nr:conserved hypothetical protein [Ricinus communis]
MVEATDLEGGITTEPHSLQWSPPPIDCIKINFDADYCKDQKVGTMGAIGHDRRAVMQGWCDEVLVRVL